MKLLPPRPRIRLGEFIILPVVDVEWKVVEDKWMLPGRRHPLTTKEVRDLAARTGQKFYILRSWT